MKLVENEIVVYNIYDRKILMHFDYSSERYMQLLEIVANMNECIKLDNPNANMYYAVQTIYGVQYEDNKSE